MDRLFNKCAGITGFLYGQKIKLDPFQIRVFNVKNEIT